MPIGDWLRINDIKKINLGQTKLLRIKIEAVSNLKDSLYFLGKVWNEIPWRQLFPPPLTFNVDAPRA